MVPIKVIPPDFFYKDTAKWDNYQHEWKKCQLKALGSSEIAPDYALKSYILSHKEYVYNIEYAGTDIQLFLKDHNIQTNNDKFDFYLITDFKFSKLPLEKIECAFRRLYGHAKIGGYAAMQSYFINYNSNKLYSEFPDSYSQSVPYWVETVLKIENFTNETLQLDNPLLRKTSDGQLISGSDFMYVHGNIRFWAWK